MGWTRALGAPRPRRLLLRPGGATWGEGGAASAGLCKVSVEGAGGGRGHLLITPAEPNSSLRVSPFRYLNRQLRPRISRLSLWPLLALLCFLVSPILSFS